MFEVQQVAACAALYLCISRHGACLTARKPATPNPTSISNPRVETFGDLISALPKTELALDNYQGDLGKVLSKILARAPKWNETGTFKSEGDGLDNSQIEHESINITVSRNSIKLYKTWLRTLTSGRTSEVMTSKITYVYFADPKRISSVTVRPHPIKPSQNFTPTSKNQVYEIAVDSENNASAFTLKTSTSTIDHTGFGEFDERNQQDSVRVADAHIEIPCDRKGAVAIGRALRRLINRKDGASSFDDQTEPPASQTPLIHQI